MVTLLHTQQSWAIFMILWFWSFLCWYWCKDTVETLYSTIYYSKYFIELNFDKSTQYVALWTHKRHPIPRPFGRAMECLLWVFQQKLTVLWRVSTVCNYVVIKDRLVNTQHPLIHTAVEVRAGISNYMPHLTWPVLVSATKLRFTNTKQMQTEYIV